MDQASPRHLRLTLTGGSADAHRVSLNDLATVATVIQTAVRGVGTVLNGGRAGTGGRKIKGVEQATELELVAPIHAGCVQLDLALAEPPDAIPGAPDADFGPRALGAFVDGVRDLTADSEALPDGFDPGVLRALERLGPVVRKGMTIGVAVASPSTSPSTTRRATIDRDRIAALGQLRQHPVRARVVVDGVLQLVDLGTDPLQCRIDRSYLPAVLCTIARDRHAEVRAAVGHFVEAEGVGTFDPAANEPRRLQVDRLEVMSEIAGVDPEGIRRHRGWRELASEQDVGPHTAGVLAGVFDSDDELDSFLASLSR